MVQEANMKRMHSEKLQSEAANKVRDVYFYGYEVVWNKNLLVWLFTLFLFLFFFFLY